MNIQHDLQLFHKKGSTRKENTALYLCCDPVCNICLHCAHMFFGIINSNKEVSSFHIQIIIQLQSVEERWGGGRARSVHGCAVGQAEILYWREKKKKKEVFNKLNRFKVKHSIFKDTTDKLLWSKGCLFQHVQWPPFSRTPGQHTKVFKH